MMAWSNLEYSQKIQRIRQLMQRHSKEALLITTQTSFLWLTGGRPFINIVSEKACADLLITTDQVYLLANNIESNRLCQEELAGLEFTSIVYSWWKSTDLSDALKDIVGNRPIATETELGLDFTKLRWTLSEEEQHRFREVGHLASEVLEDVAFSIEPGLTEIAIANQIRLRALEQDMNANVALVAVDDRTFRYRHPVPTSKRLEKYVMLVVSGQKYGLYASATRLVHFGRPTPLLEERHRAVLQVDAAFLLETMPGRNIRDIFKAGQAAYALTGFPTEWENHHQGGLAGYSSREFKGEITCPEVVAAGQVYAWNPSIAGVKSEDTFLIKDHGSENLTAPIRFPEVKVEYNGKTILRADILVR